MPNAQSGAIAVDDTLAGSASGAIMFTHMLFAPLFSQIAGLMADGTPYPMAAIVVLAAGAVPAILNRRAPGAKSWQSTGH